MKPRELCYIAVMGAIEAVVFSSFSFILYLECITLTIVLFATIFPTRQAVLAAVVFTIINLSMQGVTPWSMMYCLIYPLYSLLLGWGKGYLSRHVILTAIVCGLLSFLTGQLVQLPFLLISKNITFLYMLMGLKTSLLQGMMSTACTLVCYRPLAAVLRPIERRCHYG